MFQHVPFLKTIWSQGNWSSKRLTWNILYNDKVETVFAINYSSTTVPNFPRKTRPFKTDQFKIGRSYSKIAFLGLRKGTTFEPQFCAQKWRSHNLGEEPGKPKPSISARTPLCKSYCFGLIKGKSPCGNSMHPGDFGRNAIFTVNWGKKGGYHGTSCAFFFFTRRGDENLETQSLRNQTSR